MQFFRNTYSLAFFKTFRPEPHDALATIQDRFSGKKIIGISIGKRIKVGIIEILANGDRIVHNVSELNADGFPVKVIPDSIHSDLRMLSKLGHAIVTVSDSNRSGLKTISGAHQQDNEEATMISLSADPVSILNAADSSYSWRMIQGERASSLVGSIHSTLIAQIEEELSKFRISLARLSLSPMACFDLLFAKEEVVEQKKIPIVFDAGSIYTLGPASGRWGNIRTLNNCAGSHYSGEIDKASAWLRDTVLPQSEKSNGPSQFIAIDAGTSGELNLASDLDIEFVKIGTDSNAQHMDLITSSLN